MRIVWIGLVVTGLVVAVPSVLSFATWRLSHSLTDDAFVESHIVNVAPESVSGNLVRVLVAENDRVEEGQLLAEIDPVTYQEQVDLARSKLAAADADHRRQVANVARLKDQVPLQVELAQRTLAMAEQEQARAGNAVTLTGDEVAKTIEEAQAGVTAARSGSTLARQEYDRYTNLYRQQAVSQRRSQEVTRARDTAEAEVNAANAKLDKAQASRTRIEMSKKDLEIAKAGVRKAQSAVALARTGEHEIHEGELLALVKQQTAEEARRALTSAETQLKRTRIYAPFPGVVVKRYRNLGDFASAGSPILSMFNPDLLYVTANLEETRLRGVAPGNPVELRIDAFAEPFQGRVVWINKSTGAQFALMPRNVVAGEFTKVVQRVPVRILIEKDERWPLLRAGLSVGAAIAHGEGDAAWAEQAAREMDQLEKRYNRPQGTGDRK
jgi:membrane fusion protein (multidrug efflux system)